MAVYLKFIKIKCMIYATYFYVITYATDLAVCTYLL